MKEDKAIRFLYLSQEDVLATGSEMPDVIDCVEKVLSYHDKGQVILPSKVVLDLGERERGRINAMPAYIGGDVEVCGMKWIAGFPGNPKKFNMPRATAFIILNDSWTGRPLAVMDGTFISAMRTGAVSGVGARYLARKESRTLGIIGCGVQARTQVMALCAELKQVERIFCFDIRSEVSHPFAAEMEQKLGIQIIVRESAREVVENSDVIVTATVANEPIVKNAWVRPGSLVIHVGSYEEEEEALVLNCDKVVVDIWEEVVHRKTPILARLYEEGKIKEEDIYANIGEIINGKKKGRETEQERIFFAPLGLGSEDVIVAHKVYNMAKSKGLGKTLTLWNSPALGG